MFSTLACGCNLNNSKNQDCDYNGRCDCKENFSGSKCTKCAPDIVNYPVCKGNLSQKYGWFNVLYYTDGCNILNTPIKKHFIDLLERLRSERDKDKVSCFNVGDVFWIHLGTKYANFQKKIFAEISGKKLQTLGIT